jgi:hypothetical protein
VKGDHVAAGATVRSRGARETGLRLHPETQEHRVEAGAMGLAREPRRVIHLKRILCATPLGDGLACRREAYDDTGEPPECRRS